MNFYPYTSPIVLTDNLFVQYGGHTGSSIAAQRQAAYLIAEMAASEDFNSFLRPTIITGSYIYNPFRPTLLEHGYINSIIETKFIDKEENTLLTVNGSGNEYITLLNDEYGTVITYPVGMDIFRNQIVYNTGLTSGTSYRPDILLGLTTYADLVLNEIQGYGNESSGDIGVQNFKNQQYSETRVALIHTIYGTSARAQFAHKLFTKLRKYRMVGM